MKLLAYNLTGGPVVLAAGSSEVILQIGEWVNVTSKLKDLTLGEYAALEAQRPATVVYRWVGPPEYDTSPLKTSKETIAITNGFGDFQIIIDDS